MAANYIEEKVIKMLNESDSDLASEFKAKMATLMVECVIQNSEHLLEDLLRDNGILTEMVMNVQDSMDDHFQAVVEGGADSLVEKLEFLDEEVGKEINRLQQENTTLTTALDLLSRWALSPAEREEWIEQVNEALSAASSGAEWAGGVPDGSAAKNRKSIAGSAGSQGTTAGGSETGGGRLHETTLVERSDGKIVSLAQHKQQSFVAALCAHADRSIGIHSPGATVPTVVDAAVVDKDVGARLLAEQAPDGTFREGVEDRIAEPQERGVAVSIGGKTALTNLVNAGATRGEVYAAIEDEMPPSWTSGHLK